MGKVTHYRTDEQIDSLVLDDVPDYGQNKIIVREALKIHLRMVGCAFKDKPDNDVFSACQQYVNMLRIRGFVYTISQWDIVRSTLLQVSDITHWDVFRTSLRTALCREAMHVMKTFFNCDLAGT
jgi:hypothetical protein